MKATSLNNSINAINNVTMLLNELRSNLSREEAKRIRDKLYKKEAIYNFLKERDSLTNKEKKTVDYDCKVFDETLLTNCLTLKTNLI